MNEPLYDVIDNNNGTFCLDIAIPGLRKEDVQLAINQSVLTLTTVTRPASGYKYITKSIPDGYSSSWTIPPNYILEGAEYGQGIIRVLFSQGKPTNTIIIK